MIAVIYYSRENGRQEFTQEEWYAFDISKLTVHNKDGPAVEYINGTKYWYIDGVLHREDGPAIEYINKSRRYWFLEDQRLSKKEYNELIKEVKNMPPILRLVDPRKWVREYK